jgi:TetR/AcrR family transcriptional regulator, cholesterol catabolism regulator
LAEQRGAGDAGQPRPSSRNKRAEILTVATEYFGHGGYEDTKWADVAGAVGVGSTALYHYFESKLHCLYVIMAEAVEDARVEFDRIVGEAGFLAGLNQVLNSRFELSELQVQRNRVLVAEQGRLGERRKSPREEEARQVARTRTRDYEVVWTTHLARGMEQGLVPEADPQLLTRAVLGLYNSVWHWYRPGGTLGLDRVAEFYVPRHLALIGLEPSSNGGAPAPS